MNFYRTLFLYSTRVEALLPQLPHQGTSLGNASDGRYGTTSRSANILSPVSEFVWNRKGKDQNISV